MLDTIERYRRRDRNYIPRWGTNGMACRNRFGRKGRPPYCRDMNQRLPPRRGVGNLSLFTTWYTRGNGRPTKLYRKPRCMRGNRRNHRSDFAPRGLRGLFSPDWVIKLEILRSRTCLTKKRIDLDRKSRLNINTGNGFRWIVAGWSIRICFLWDTSTNTETYL